jgi:hypothetical protein
MNHLIQKIDLPTAPRTGVIEERKLFAKMMEHDRIKRRAARRARMLALFGWRRKAERVPGRRTRKAEQPTRAAGAKRRKRVS